MFSALKFMISFCFSFLLLSIPVQKKPLFFYLNQWAQPITEEIFTGSKDVLLNGVKQSKTFGKKLFNNTAPSTDNISLQSSSTVKRKKTLEDIDHGEAYTAEEKDMLLNILKDQ